MHFLDVFFFLYPHVGYIFIKNSCTLSFWNGWLVPFSTHCCHLSFLFRLFILVRVLCPSFAWGQARIQVWVVLEIFFSL